MYNVRMHIIIPLIIAGASALPFAAYGPGTGPIYLTSLMCTGNETGILDCPHSGTIGSTGCQHFQDTSVICDPRISESSVQAIQQH